MMIFCKSSAKSLSESQWQIVHVIAQTLAKEQSSLDSRSEGMKTEFKKVISYLYSIIEQTDAVSHFFKYLNKLTRYGQQIGHSQKTSKYYRIIEETCRLNLQDIQHDAKTALLILGWAARLLSYYKEFDSIAEFEVSGVQSSHQTKNAQVYQSTKFDVEQILEATVISIKGNQVTYQILEVLKRTEKEPKKAASLKKGQVVKVKITALKADGDIKNVKCVD
jgi:hypothetical protein